MDSLDSAQTPARLEAQGDRRAAAGDLAGACGLLRQAAALDPSRPAPWLKLAGLERARGNLPAALEAVTEALRIEPLGFLPLLLKATLLEALGRAEAAGETYGYALAQLPPDTPPAMAATVARARAAHAAHVERRSGRLAAAQEAAGAALDTRRAGADGAVPQQHRAAHAALSCRADALPLSGPARTRVP